VFEVKVQVSGDVLHTAPDIDSQEASSLIVAEIACAS